MKLLLVEDNPMIQFMHKAMLHQLQCDVDVVDSGEDAIAIAKVRDYDLIFLEIGLPGITGIETALKISALKNHLKTRLVALTFSSDESSTQKCFSVGIEKVLHKPIDIKQLASVIFEPNEQFHLLQ
jgi:DNA-binding response OmpR family regulator